MQLLIIMVSSLLLVHSARSFYSPYQNVRQCRSYSEPCISLGCGTTQSSGTFPYRVTYGCCLGRIFDQRKHVCTLRGGVTRLESCNPRSQFHCGSGECMLTQWTCDRIKNCLDGSDEMGCGSCGSNYFRCKNGRCVYKRYVCNKVNNCGDGTDESTCLKPDGTSCGWNRYRCNNNKCTKLSYVCDSDNDCGDWSDESRCSWSGKKRSTRYLSQFDDVQENNKTEGATDNEPKDAEKPPILIKN